MTSSKRKNILNAALKALIAGAETSPAIKIPAAFISELAALPKEQQERFACLNQQQFNDLLTQAELATVNAANAAVGTKQNRELIEKLIAKVDVLRNLSGKSAGTGAEYLSGLKKSPLDQRQYVVFAAGGNDLLKVSINPKVPIKDSIYKHIKIPQKARSLDIIETKGQKYIALGSANTVELRPIEEWNKKGVVYKIKGSFSPGNSRFYSIGCYNGSLYASHSTLGLFFWKLNNPKKQEARIKGKKESGLRYSTLVFSNNQPCLVFLEGDHQMWATPFSNLDEKIDVFSTNKTVKGIVKIREFSISSFIEHDGLINVSLFGGKEGSRIYLIDPNKFEVCGKLEVPYGLNIWAMHSIRWTKEKYLAISSRDCRVLVYDPKTPSKNIFLHTLSSQEPFHSLDSIAGCMFGANNKMFYAWDLSKTQLAVTLDEWSGHYKGVKAIENEDH